MTSQKSQDVIQKVQTPINLPNPPQEAPLKHSTTYYLHLYLNSPAAKIEDKRIAI